MINLGTSRGLVTKISAVSLLSQFCTNVTIVMNTNIHIKLMNLWRSQMDCKNKYKFRPIKQTQVKQIQLHIFMTGP